MTAYAARHDEHADLDIIVRQLALRALERSTGAHLDAMIHNGCVTLTGRVDSAESRNDAERAVRAVPGILQVLTHIEVTTPRRERTARIFRWPFGHPRREPTAR